MLIRRALAAALLLLYAEQLPRLSLPQSALFSLHAQPPPDWSRPMRASAAGAASSRAASRSNSRWTVGVGMTPAQQAMALDIAKNGDPFGTKTEALVSDVIRSHGGIRLEGAQYEGKKGYDEVAVWMDAEGRVNLTFIIESKQLGPKGVVLNPNAAGGEMQMSELWDQVVLERLPKTSKARMAIEDAAERGTLVKGVAYVDKSDGTLKITRIDPKKLSQGISGAPGTSPAKPNKETP